MLISCKLCCKPKLAHSVVIVLPAKAHHLGIVNGEMGNRKQAALLTILVHHCERNNLTGVVSPWTTRNQGKKEARRKKRVDLLAPA